MLGCMSSWHARRSDVSIEVWRSGWKILGSTEGAGLCQALGLGNAMMPTDMQAEERQGRPRSCMLPYARLRGDFVA